MIFIFDWNSIGNEILMKWIVIIIFKHYSLTNKIEDIEDPIIMIHLLNLNQNWISDLKNNDFCTKVVSLLSVRPSINDGIIVMPNIQ